MEELILLNTSLDSLAQALLVGWLELESGRLFTSGK